MGDWCSSPLRGRAGYRFGCTSTPCVRQRHDLVACYSDSPPEPPQRARQSHGCGASPRWRSADCATRSTILTAIRVEVRGLPRARSRPRDGADLVSRNGDRVGQFTRSRPSCALPERALRRSGTHRDLPLTRSPVVRNFPRKRRTNARISRCSRAAFRQRPPPRASHFATVSPH